MQGFCDEIQTHDEQYGTYLWLETSVGDVRELLCVFGPQSATATRECVSQGEWDHTIDYNQCYTLTTMRYQNIDLVG